MTLSFNARHPYVLRDSRWIASLSDGTTVFEDVDIAAGPSCWRRLHAHLKLHRLKITNLRLEHGGKRVVLVPYKDDEGNAQINGYFYSNRMSALVATGLNVQLLDRGIGYVKADRVYVTWVREDGTIQQEIKQIVRTETDKSDEHHVLLHTHQIIWNDPIWV